MSEVAKDYSVATGTVHAILVATAVPVLGERPRRRWSASMRPGPAAPDGPSTRPVGGVGTVDDLDRRPWTRPALQGSTAWPRRWHPSRDT